MASYLQIENISKSYGPKILFENIGFNINEGDKIALIAPNGTGKTSLLKILAGKDRSDSGGKITFLRNIRIAFLEQEYDFDPEKDIFTQIMDHSAGFTSGLDDESLWQYELRVRQFLTNFKLPDFSKKMKELSGGEIKRVAISEMLASEADFFIMDEPTNHLDIDAIEFLEGWLSRARCTLLMVTHDRYFLDRVCNTVMEMDHGSIYIYRGDYRNYLEKREELTKAYSEPVSSSSGARGSAPSVRFTAEGSVSESKLSWQEQKEQQAKERKRKNDLKKTEEEIGRLEERNAQIDHELTLEEVYSNSVRCQELALERSENESRLEELYERWAELEI